MDLIQNLYNAFEGDEVEKTPVGTNNSAPIAEVMDQINVHYPEAHAEVEPMVKMALMAHEYAGFETITTPFDMTLEAEAMGCVVDLKSGIDSPEIKEVPFSSIEDVDIDDDFLNQGRFPVLEKAIVRIREECDTVPIICCSVGPFTILGQLIGVEELLKLINTDYGAVEDALDVVVDASCEEMKMISEWDVDAINMADPSSGPDLLPPDTFEDLVQPAFETVSDEMGYHSVLHVCGNTTPIIEYMLDCGFSAISVEDAVDINFIHEQQEEVESDTKIFGNISTSQSLFNGTPEDVAAEVKVALDKKVDILAPSCGVPAKSPLTNLQAMVKARDDYFA